MRMQIESLCGVIVNAPGAAFDIPAIAVAADLVRARRWRAILILILKFELLVVVQRNKKEERCTLVVTCIVQSSLMIVRSVGSVHYLFHSNTVSPCLFFLFFRRRVPLRIVELDRRGPVLALAQQIEHSRCAPLMFCLKIYIAISLSN